MFWIIVASLVSLSVIYYLYRSAKDQKEIKRLEANAKKNIAENNRADIRKGDEMKKIPSNSFLEFISRNDTLVIFDVETNGLDSNRHSVLSCSAIKCKMDSGRLMEIARFNRFYYPVEKSSPAATKINGLTRAKIKELRGKADYPKHFRDDSGFQEFCQSCKSFIAHNMEFDQRFLPFSIGDNCFCTMKSNTDTVKALWMNSKGGWKWPTLKETADYYNIPVQKDALHGSMYDVTITFGIIQEMYKKFPSE